jgi:hypothetical protein
MTKIRCGYTSCKNNKQSGDGYFCKLREISLISYSNTIYFRMICEQYSNKKDYAPSTELQIWRHK